ncbi:hypothetical protein [Plantibacter flavus]|uniref:hypothetical protein n=1 Tax=Plantibacter flavus TaxID=150123 RepID=UPI003392F6E8
MFVHIVAAFAQMFLAADPGTGATGNLADSHFAFLVKFSPDRIEVMGMSRKTYQLNVANERPWWMVDAVDVDHPPGADPRRSGRDGPRSDRRRA